MPLNGELGLLFTEEVYKEEDDNCDGLIFPNVLMLELVDIGNYLT